MAYDLRYPMITGASEKEQLIQMKSYLHQLVEQLNYSLNNIDKVQVQYVRTPSSSESSKKEEDKGTQATFDALKPLIIKSAEIVNSYYETINERLEGIYVAQSDFGTFVEQTSQDITKNSTDITQVFTNVQEIDTRVSSIDTYTTTIDNKVTTIDTKVTTIDTELKTVEDNVGAVDTELQNVKSGVGSNLQVLTEDVEQVGSDLQGFKEETDTNIKGISETLGTVSDSLGQVDTELQGFKDDTSKDLDNIKDEIENIKYMIIDVNAYIKSGLLYYDDNEIPVYGLEIGQRNTVDGVEVFNKYARFTSDRLSFYDQNDIEVAYISDKKLYIANVEVLASYKIGGLKQTVLANGDVVEKWVGIGGEE
jgi:uncharacterized phage infection (PIP) family protein YhgE